jgi:hypothetical protein
LVTVLEVLKAGGGQVWEVEVDDDGATVARRGSIEHIFRPTNTGEKP